MRMNTAFKTILPALAFGAVSLMNTSCKTSQKALTQQQYLDKHFMLSEKGEKQYHQTGQIDYSQAVERTMPYSKKFDNTKGRVKSVAPYNAATDDLGGIPGVNTAVKIDSGSIGSRQVKMERYNYFLNDQNKPLQEADGDARRLVTRDVASYKNQKGHEEKFSVTFYYNSKTKSGEPLSAANEKDIFLDSAIVSTNANRWVYKTTLDKYNLGQISSDSCYTGGSYRLVENDPKKQQAAAQAAAQAPMPTSFGQAMQAPPPAPSITADAATMGRAYTYNTMQQLMNSQNPVGTVNQLILDYFCNSREALEFGSPTSSGFIPGFSAPSSTGTSNLSLGGSSGFNHAPANNKTYVVVNQKTGKHTTYTLK